MTTKTVTVAVTGAAGQIGYSLLFRLASGEVFGKNTKVNLKLLEVPEGLKGAEGTAMELIDCAFPALGSVNCYDDPNTAFDGAHWVLMIGSKPRGPGMERSDLIKANGPIFVTQGKALQRADRSVRAIVVGNPCNTNALIAMHNCPDVPVNRISAMTALDENRAIAQIALRAKVGVEAVSNLAVWGNHSPTMFPSFEHALINGQPLTDTIKDRAWLEGDFLKCVQNRGAEIIAARGKSSAASAASACIDHLVRMSTPTPKDRFYSAAVPSNGEFYNVPKGLIFSFPLRTKEDGSIEIVKGIKLSPFAEAKIAASAKELEGERKVIADLL